MHTLVVTWTDICHLGVWMLAAMMSVHFPAFVHNVLKHFCYFDSNCTCLPQIVQEDEEERLRAMFEVCCVLYLLRYISCELDSYQVSCVLFRVWMIQIYRTELGA